MKEAPVDSLSVRVQQGNLLPPEQNEQVADFASVERNFGSARTQVDNFSP